MVKHDLTKRYWLFVFYTYYPCGGLEDIRLTSNNLMEINNEILREKSKTNYSKDWVHFQLVDIVTGKYISKRDLKAVVKGGQ